MFPFIITYAFAEDVLTRYARLHTTTNAIKHIVEACVVTQQLHKQRNEKLYGMSSCKQIKANRRMSSKVMRGQLVKNQQ